MTNLLYKITETRNVFINSLVAFALTLLFIGVLAIVCNLLAGNVQYSFNL